METKILHRNDLATKSIGSVLYDRPLQSVVTNYCDFVVLGNVVFCESNSALRNLHVELRIGSPLKGVTNFGSEHGIGGVSSCCFLLKFNQSVELKELNGTRWDGGKEPRNLPRSDASSKSVHGSHCKGIKLVKCLSMLLKMRRFAVS